MRQDKGWQQRPDAKVKFVGFPTPVSTKRVWELFSKHGFVDFIELNFNAKGDSDGTGIVIFRLVFCLFRKRIVAPTDLARPPPKQPIWQITPYSTRLPGSQRMHHLRLDYLGGRKEGFLSGLRNTSAKYPEFMEIRAESLDCGVLTAPLVMKTMFSTLSNPDAPVTLRQNLRNREIEIIFPVWPNGEAQPSTRLQLHGRRVFRLQMSHTEDIKVFEVLRSENASILVISVGTPPVVHRKLLEAESHSEESGTYKWSSREAWWRQTDISYDLSQARNIPTSLRKATHGINVARWTTYRLHFATDKCGSGEYLRMCNALRDFNINVRVCPEFQFTDINLRPVWDYIDGQERPELQGYTASLTQLLDEDFLPLEFEVRYQLEVCISEGWLSEYSLSRSFLEALRDMGKQSAAELLELVSAQKQRYFDAMEIFQLWPTRPAHRKIPSHCVLMRAVTVTPTTVIFSSPTLETSNRVIRQFKEISDRFIRVRFADEKGRGKIYATLGDQNNELFTRVKRTMTNGIVIGDRRYEFLAFGNSQFRENGAFFFAPTAHTTTDWIRGWMGDFSEIRTTAKYAARLGQCFSTTQAIHSSKVQIKEIVDIKTTDQRYTFSDGVGVISPLLAWFAARETKDLLPCGNPPSVMQFRLGGAKGVLAVWPQAKSNEIHMRPSQFKFSAVYEGLEVIRWSRFAAAHLNRQLITVLSARGIPDWLFMKLLDSDIANLLLAMTDQSVALSMLQKQVDPNQMTLTLAAMILDGFRAAREPFMISLLKLWRAFSLKHLKEKAKIAIQDGAILLGCMDESGKLKGYFNLRQPQGHYDNDLEALPEVFVQLSKGANGKPQVLQGIMLVARNPSLYTGDVQAVRGVDIPELRHVKDAIVFPKNGDRDIPSMLSGGDLDGDDFVVIWDQRLIPDRWHEEPSNFEATAPPKLDREPTMDEVSTFFVQYMKNDTLPTIALAHLATADDMPMGPRDRRCIQLAQLHSKAVDYPKTGEIVKMPAQLVPRRFPHFMERKSRSYYSRKVLGQLYDRVSTQSIDFIPDYEAHFHQGILEAFSLDQGTLQTVKDIKTRYDLDMHRIMSQHDIGTDFEVWSTFVMKHTKMGSDYKFHDQIGTQSAALKELYRNECYEKAGGRDYESLAPFVAAMYKVTQDEIKEAVDLRKRVAAEGGEQELIWQGLDKKSMPFMSFPWLFPTVLGQIANRRLDGGMQKLVVDTSSMTLQQDLKPTKSKAPLSSEDELSDNVAVTNGSSTHIGEPLALFQDGKAWESNGEAAEKSSQDIKMLAEAGPLDTSDTWTAGSGQQGGTSSDKTAISLSPKESPLSPRSQSFTLDKAFAEQSLNGGEEILDSAGLRREEEALREVADENLQSSDNDADNEMEEEVELSVVGKPNPFDQLAHMNVE